MGQLFPSIDHPIREEVSNEAEISVIDKNVKTEKAQEEGLEEKTSFY